MSTLMYETDWMIKKSYHNAKVNSSKWNRILNVYGPNNKILKLEIKLIEKQGEINT